MRSSDVKLEKVTGWENAQRLNYMSYSSGKKWKHIWFPGMDSSHSNLIMLGVKWEATMYSKKENNLYLALTLDLILVE